MAELFAGINDAPVDLNGVLVYPGWLTRSQQNLMIADLREVARAAPFQRYEIPGGRQMSVQMTAAGDVGWMADRSGYRYAPRHSDGGDWPDMPDSILGVWRSVSGVDHEPTLAGRLCRSRWATTRFFELAAGRGTIRHAADGCRQAMSPYFRAKRVWPTTASTGLSSDRRTC